MPELYPRKVPLLHKHKLPIFCMVFNLTLILLLGLTFKQAIAHGGRLHLPYDLPACTARIMVCEPTSSSFSRLPAASANVDDSQNASVPTVPSSLESLQDQQHCLDGAGVPQSCTQIAPFQYMPQDLSIEKGGLIAAQKFDAMSATPCVDKMAGPFPCSNIDMLSFLPLNEMDAVRGNDVWGWTDPSNGGEYVLMGLSDGTAFVDISDPVAPIYLGKLPTADGIPSSWRDLKVYDNHAFIVTDSPLGLPRRHGMQVFDLTQLSTIITQTLPITFSATTVYDRIYSAHNVAINEETGYAYIVGSRDFESEVETCSGGLHMVNITTPSSPTFAGCFSGDGYTHDTQCVIYQGPDVEHQGSEICFNSNEDTITIVDVTDKSSPLQLSKVDYFCSFSDDPTTCNPDVRGGKLYVHQGWLTEDQQFFLQNDEKDENGGVPNTRTHLWDVKDLDNPIYMGDSLLATESYDHNLYVEDLYVYAANYTAGLRIMDATHITATTTLYEVAYFDTYPENNRRNYNSAWSSYPFFDSGVVAVSTTNEGLFILQPNLARVVLKELYMPFVPQ